jgi:hypothetical protein
MTMPEDTLVRPPPAGSLDVRRERYPDKIDFSSAAHARVRP